MTPLPRAVRRDPQWDVLKHELLYVQLHTQSKIFPSPKIRVLHKIVCPQATELLFHLSLVMGSLLQHRLTPAYLASAASPPSPSRRWKAGLRETPFLSHRAISAAFTEKCSALALGAQAKGDDRARFRLCLTCAVDPPNSTPTAQVSREEACVNVNVRNARRSPGSGNVLSQQSLVAGKVGRGLAHAQKSTLHAHVRAPDQPVSSRN